MPEKSYELKGLAGRGGTSAIYFAVSKKNRNKYAFKVPEAFGNLDDLQKEAVLQKKIRRRQVPAVIGCMRIEGKTGLLMEWKGDRSLEILLQEERAFTEEEVLLLGMDLCRLLEYMHTRNPPIYYLDMKPSNILMKEGRFSVLVDFGCAQEMGADGTIRADGRGTREYAAPEQFRPGELLDCRTDLYGLGKVLLEVSGNGVLSCETAQLLRNCVKTRLEERPSSARILYRRMKKIYQHQSAVRKKRRKKSAVIISFILAVLFIGICIGEIRTERRVRYGSELLAEGRELWHGEQGMEGKFSGCRLCETALTYGFQKEEERQEALCYAKLAGYYGKVSFDRNEAAKQLCQLAEVLIVQKCPGEEVLEVAEELLLVLYEADEMSELLREEILAKTRGYLEYVRRTSGAALKPQTEDAEELLSAVENTKKGTIKDE